MLSYLKGLNLIKAPCSVKIILLQSQEHCECLMIKVTWGMYLKTDRSGWKRWNSLCGLDVTCWIRVKLFLCVSSSVCLLMCCTVSMCFRSCTIRGSDVQWFNVIPYVWHPSTHQVSYVCVNAHVPTEDIFTQTNVAWLQASWQGNGNFPC